MQSFRLLGGVLIVMLGVSCGSMRGMEEPKNQIEIPQGKESAVANVAELHERLKTLEDENKALKDKFEDKRVEEGVEIIAKNTGNSLEKEEENSDNSESEEKNPISVYSGGNIAQVGTLAALAGAGMSFEKSPNKYVRNVAIACKSIGISGFLVTGANVLNGNNVEHPTDGLQNATRIGAANLIVQGISCTNVGKSVSKFFQPTGISGAEGVGHYGSSAMMTGAVDRVLQSYGFAKRGSKLWEIWKSTKETSALDKKLITYTGGGMALSILGYVAARRFTNSSLLHDFTEGAVYGAFVNGACTAHSLSMEDKDRNNRFGFEDNDGDKTTTGVVMQVGGSMLAGGVATILMKKAAETEAARKVFGIIPKEGVSVLACLGASLLIGKATGVYSFSYNYTFSG
ncbi:MAG TPA: hypothetical protein VEK38_02320 [Candidatus Bathyarchaeia archaeon]|nr:hypothetical protein [Candidatus Bathyarchaeia archaeon]